MDQGVVTPAGTTGKSFESMDGTSREDIYAVGLQGEMWHFDGRAWQQIDSPTNANLFEVHCVSSELVYAVGANGVVVRGAGARWQVLQSDAFKDGLWGVASFGDEVYVAGFNGIARIVGNDLKPVTTGLGKIGGYRLRAKYGVLWSIGNEHVLRYDGQKWEELVCLDNQ